MVLSRKDESKLNSVLLYEQGRRKYRSRSGIGVKAYTPIAVSDSRKNQKQEEEEFYSVFRNSGALTIIVSIYSKYH